MCDDLFILGVVFYLVAHVGVLIWVVWREHHSTAEDFGPVLEEEKRETNNS